MIKAIGNLIRIDVSIANCLTFFIPILYITKDFELASKLSITLFFLLSCSFTGNDIYDKERDIVNHPNRTLPQSSLSESQCVMIYYSFLACTLIAIKLFLSWQLGLLFLVYLVLSTNYNYIIIGFPALKTFYVLGLAAVHLTILEEATKINISIMIALGFNVLFREFLRDIEDKEGDGRTFVNILSTQKMFAWLCIIQLIIIIVVWSYVIKEFSSIKFINGILITLLSFGSLLNTNIKVQTINIYCTLFQHVIIFFLIL